MVTPLLEPDELQVLVQLFYEKNGYEKCSKALVCLWTVILNSGELFRLLNCCAGEINQYNKYSQYSKLVGHGAQTLGGVATVLGGIGAMGAGVTAIFTVYRHHCH